MSFCTVPTVHASVMADMILTKVPSAHGRFQSESVQTWCSKRYSIHGQFKLASKSANGVLHFHFYVCFCVYCVASVDKNLSSWVLFINLLFEWSQHSSCGRRCGKVDRNKVFAVVRLVLQNHHLSQLLSSKVENHWNKWWRFPIPQKLCSSKGFPKARKSAFGRQKIRKQQVSSLQVRKTMKSMKHCRILHVRFFGTPCPPPARLRARWINNINNVINCHRLEYLSLKENYGKLIGTTFWNKQNHSSETFRKHCNIITQPKGPWNESLNSNFPTMSLCNRWLNEKSCISKTHEELDKLVSLNLMLTPSS